MSTEITPLLRGRKAVPIYIGYLVAVILFVVPVLFMIWSAFRASIDITGDPFNVFSALTLDNYVKVFENFDFARYIGNSFLIAGTSTILGLVLGGPAAYVIVRRKWTHVGFFILIARMAPGVMFLLPLFFFSVSIGAPSNTPLNYALLIAAHLIITLPLCIWLLIPFFEAVPESLEEASMIDGATVMKRFLSIIVPLVTPGIAVATTLSFVFSWNYFLFALALANTDTIPLPVIAFSFIGEGQSDYGALMAASTLISLPALVLSIIAQRWLVRGLTGGAVK